MYVVGLGRGERLKVVDGSLVEGGMEKILRNLLLEFVLMVRSISDAS